MSKHLPLKTDLPMNNFPDRTCWHQPATHHALNNVHVCPMFLPAYCIVPWANYFSSNCITFPDTGPTALILQTELQSIKSPWNTECATILSQHWTLASVRHFLVVVAQWTCAMTFAFQVLQKYHTSYKNYSLQFISIFGCNINLSLEKLGLL